MEMLDEQKPDTNHNQNMNKAQSAETMVLSEEFWASLMKMAATATTEEFPDKTCPSQPYLGSLPVSPFFFRHQRLSLFDKIKIAFGSLILVPIRTVGMLLFITLAWLLAHIQTAFLSLEDLDNVPLTKWRLVLGWIATRIFMRGFVFFAGFQWVTIKGKRATSAEAPVLVAAPHSSFFDGQHVIVLGAASLVTRAATRNEPFTGKLIEVIQPITVAREDRGSRSATVKAIKDRAEKITKDPKSWFQIYIYPEGTCSNRSCLFEFKVGAFLPGVPVQPVLIKYPNRLDTITWTYDGVSFLKQLWFNLCQFTVHIELEFLPVYHPSQEEKNDARLYANNVRQVMAKALRIPAVDYTMEDGNAMANLCARGISDKLRRISTDRKILKPSPLAEIKVMRKLASPTMKPFMATQEAFIQDFVLSNPEPDILAELFSSLANKDNGDGDGELIDEREYLVYACLLSPANFRVEQLIQSFFLMYSHGRKDMSKEEFTTFTRHIFLESAEAEDKLKVLVSESYDLQSFTKLTLKRLEHVKLCCLEVSGLISQYPTRDFEVSRSTCKSTTSSKFD